ncbi:unnamed protein product [marine sediment metagenome]|uniref:Uncharacterized protein n=1 Tax=marine sediment metagenome TaxID=412755 RepID=X0W960_9ZZZZ
MPDSTVNAVEKIAQACDVQQPCGSIGPGRFKQDVVRLVPAQDVIDEVCRHRHLPACFLAAWVPALNETGDNGHLPE